MTQILSTKITKIVVSSDDVQHWSFCEESGTVSFEAKVSAILKTDEDTRFLIGADWLVAKHDLVLNAAKAPSQAFKRILQDGGMVFTVQAFL